MQGLGKTIQVIGLVAALLGKTGRRADDIRLPLSPYSERKILIVVPTSVLANWKNEFERWLYFAPNALGLAHGDQVFASSHTHSSCSTLTHRLIHVLALSLVRPPTHSLASSRGVSQFDNAMYRLEQGGTQVLLTSHGLLRNNEVRANR